MHEELKEQAAAARCKAATLYERTFTRPQSQSAAGEPEYRVLNPAAFHKENPLDNAAPIADDQCSGPKFLSASNPGRLPGRSSFSNSRQSECGKSVNKTPEPYVVYQPQHGENR